MKPDKVMDALMAEMFKRAGKEWPDKEFTAFPEWYAMHLWTEDEDEDFKAWAVDFLRKKAKWSKGVAEKEYGWFHLCWGWTCDNGCHERAKKQYKEWSDERRANKETV